MLSPFLQMRISETPSDRDVAYAKIPCNFSLTRLVAGMPLPEISSEEMTYLVTRKGPADLLATPEGLPILSERLIELVQQQAPDAVQPINMHLVDDRTGAPVAGYRLANLLHRIPCIDLERSVTTEMDLLGHRVVNVIQPVLRRDAIPLSVHLFRPDESPDAIMLSTPLAEWIVTRGFRTGITFVKVDCE